MGVSFKEILEKYETKFNIEEIPETILNAGTGFDDVTIDDVEEPKMLERGEGTKYLFKANNYSFLIDDFLNTYTAYTVWEDKYGMTHTITFFENGETINT